MDPAIILGQKTKLDFCKQNGFPEKKERNIQAKFHQSISSKCTTPKRTSPTPNRTSTNNPTNSHPLNDVPLHKLLPVRRRSCRWRNKILSGIRVGPCAALSRAAALSRSAGRRRGSRNTFSHIRCTLSSRSSAPQFYVFLPDMVEQW